MPEPDEKPESSVTRDVLGADLASVEEHLDRRFPDAAADEIQEAIDAAAGDLADAKITTFRPLLVEHIASDTLRDRDRDQLRDSRQRPPDPLHQQDDGVTAEAG